MAELDNWVKVIEASPETGWPAFYKSAIGQPVSNIETLFQCVEIYGFWPTFEAILAAQRKKISGDALSYVWAVAQARWKDSHVQLSEDGKYSRGIQRSKWKTIQQNEELEEKLRKAKEQ